VQILIIVAINLVKFVLQVPSRGL